MKIILQKWHIREFLFNLKTNMKTTLKTSVTVKEICDGFVYNQLEGKGLFGLSGKYKHQCMSLIVYHLIE